MSTRPFLNTAERGVIKRLRAAFSKREMDCTDGEMEVNPDVTVSRGRKRAAGRRENTPALTPGGRVGGRRGEGGGLRCETRGVVAD